MANEKVMSTADLKLAIQTIKDIIENPIAQDNYHALQSRLMYLSSIISLTATCVADAKRNLLFKKSQVIELMSSSGIPASILSKQIDSMCWEEESMYEECERMNKAVTRCGEWLQTVISAQKEEMKLQGSNLVPSTKK